MENGLKLLFNGVPPEQIVWIGLRYIISYFYLPMGNLKLNASSKLTKMTIGGIELEMEATYPVG